MAAAADFTIAGLLTDTGVSRAQFRRCFAGKSQLLAALTQDGAKALGEILKVAQPVEILQAVGSDVTPAAPIADAWLERRLRVFERALAGLEKRQEKSEQSLGRKNWRQGLPRPRSRQRLIRPSPIFCPASRRAPK